VRIALAQLDVRPGDAEANAERAREAIAEASVGGAELVVFPELFLTGFLSGQGEQDDAYTSVEVAALVGAADGPALLVGFHEREGSRSYNSAVYLDGDAIVHVQRKLYLVDYPPFDEDDVFAAGDELLLVDGNPARLSVLICNDAWQPFLPFIAVRDGARVLLMPSASSTAVPEAEPYWRDLTRFYAQMLESYVVYVNRVGREGAFTFWGGSHVVGPEGELVVEAPRLEEALVFADLDLERVDERRRALPLLQEPRLDLLRAELDRLARKGSTIPLQSVRRGGKTDPAFVDPATASATRFSTNDPARRK
jgi:predicted amidohydrolase